MERWVPSINKQLLREIIIAAAVVVIMYQVGWLVVFLLCPLQILYFRRGLVLQRYASILAFAVLAVLKLFFIIANSDSIAFYTFFLSMLFFVVSILALLFWNMAQERKISNQISFPVISGLYALANACSFIFLMNNTELMSNIASQLTQLETQLSPVVSDGENQFLLFLFQFAISSSWFSAACILLVNHVVAIFIVSRKPLPDGSEVQKITQRWKYFRLADWYLWIFIVGWGLVLINFFLNNSILQYLSWNIALFAALLYAIQGYVIALNLVSKKRPEMQKIFIWMSIVAVFVPVLNVLFPIALQLLGLSLHWVDWYQLGKEWSK